MTNPMETVEWLAVRFRDDADTSPGEAHLESDAIEVEAVRDSFTDMLAALKSLEAELQRLKALCPHVTENVDQRVIDRARAVIAKAARC